MIMDSLKNIVQPNLLKELQKVSSSVEVPNSSIWYDYELLNNSIGYGYLNLANFLLDRDCKVNNQSKSNTPSSTPLHNAIKWYNAPLVKRLLAKQASIIAMDAQRNTPLHLAFFLRSPMVDEVLLKHLMATANYINVKNIHGLSHLHIAAARGNTLAVQKFLEAGANVADVVGPSSPVYKYYSALNFACHAKSLETIKLIMRARQFLDSQNEEHFQNLLEEKSFRDAIKSVIAAQRLWSFHFVCLSSTLDKVEELLDQNATSVNKRTGVNVRFSPLYTPLHFAIEGDVSTYDKAKLLLQRGANVELLNAFSMTPLHLAFYYSDFRSIDDTVKLLYTALRNKDANAMDCNGLTYFHIAVAMNDFATVELLLRQGVDVNQAVLPNQRNFSYYTPLHFAVKYRRRDMAKLLIERGAKVNNEEATMTPLQMACQAGHTGLMELLVQSKAKIDVVCPESGKTMLHLFVENAVDREENLWYLRKKNFRNHESRPDDVRRWIRQLVAIIDVDTQDRQGNTALHVVCSNILLGSRFAKDLLWYGADLNIENENGYTPFDLACKSKVGDSMPLYHHVQKLKALGLEVHPRNEACCELLMRKYEWRVVDMKDEQRDLEFRRKQIDKEIEKLKKVKLDEDVTLYDFMRMTKENAAIYVLKVLKIARATNWKEVFPLYGYMPYLRFKKCFKWLKERVLKRKKAEETAVRMSIKRPRYR